MLFSFSQQRLCHFSLFSAILLQFPLSPFHPLPFSSGCTGEPGRRFLVSLSGFSRAVSPHLSLLQLLLGPNPVITTHQSVTASKKKPKKTGCIQDVHTGTLFSAHVNQIYSETGLVRLLRAKTHYRNLEPKVIYTNWQRQRTDVDLPARNSHKFKLCSRHFERKSSLQWNGGQLKPQSPITTHWVTPPSICFTHSSSRLLISSPIPHLIRVLHQPGQTWEPTECDQEI